MKDKVVALVICRIHMIANKMLKKINGKTIIDIVISRLKASKMIDEIILLTTNNKIDDKFLKVAKKNKINICRGSEHNVLNRVNRCLKIKTPYKYIVRANGDCPFNTKYY